MRTNRYAPELNLACAVHIVKLMGVLYIDKRDIWIHNFVTALQVRRCAQGCLVEIFDVLQNRSIIKKASKVILHMFQNYIPIAEKLKPLEDSDTSHEKMISKSENVEVIYMLTLLKLLAPKLQEKVGRVVLSCTCKLLGRCLSFLNGQVIGLLQALVENYCVEVLLSESESILCALTKYLSVDEKHPDDTIVSASCLLKTCLYKFHTSQPTLWAEYFPPIFSSLAGIM
jgi:ribosomal RNA-processing protein 12